MTPRSSRATRRSRRSSATTAVDARSFKASLLLEPWELETGKGDPYRVFTPFWKAALKRPEPGAPVAAPRDLKAPSKWPAGLELDALGLMPAIRWYDGLAAHWQPGEDGAHARLEAWCDGGLGEYASGRNRPDRDGTSALSPWSAPRRVIAAPGLACRDRPPRRAAGGRARVLAAGARLAGVRAPRAVPLPAHPDRADVRKVRGVPVARGPRRAARGVAAGAHGHPDRRRGHAPAVGTPAGCTTASG
jgi:hypothetical protein